MSESPGLFYNHTIQKSKEDVSRTFPISRETGKSRTTILAAQGLGTYVVMSVASIGVAVAVTMVVVFVVSFIDYSVLTGRRAW